MSHPDVPEPYVGLRPFASHESHLFFGRADQIVGMLQRMESGRFLAVIGASGCGKSSLVRAGLLPAVANRFVMNEPEEWQFVTIKPGDNPFHSLADGILRTQTGDQLRVAHNQDIQLETDELVRLESTLRCGRRSLLDVVTNRQAGEPHPLLLLVDQFEELFRYRREQQRTESASTFKLRDDALAFVDLLLGTVESSGASLADFPGQSVKGQSLQCNTLSGQPHIYVVITMRSDFMGHCEAFTGLPEKISECQFLTPRMTRQQLEKAIVEPLRVYAEFACQKGETFPKTQAPAAAASRTFINRLLNDVGTKPDLLPLLQHALKRTWQQARRRSQPHVPIKLTVAEYEAVGGLNDALNQHATEIYNAWAEDESCESRLQLVCRRLFCSLSDRREDGPLVRRPRTIDEIAAELAARNDADTTRSDVLSVAAPFAKENLLVFSPEPVSGADPDGNTRLDISHESLLRQWEKLTARDEQSTSWLDIEYNDVMRYRQLVGFAQHGNVLSGPIWHQFDSWYKNRQPTEAWCERFAEGHYDQVEAFRERCRAADEKRLEKERAERRERDRLEREAQIEKEQRLKEQAKAKSAEQLAEQQRLLADQAEKLAELERMTAAKEKERANEAARRFKQVSIVGGIAAVLFLIAFAASMLWYEGRVKLREAGKIITKQALTIASTISESAESYRSNPEALKDFEDLRDILLDFDRAEPNDSDVLAALGNVYNRIGNIHHEEHEYQLAIDDYKDALAVRGKIAQERLEYKRKFANAHMNRANAETELGRQKQLREREQAAAHFDRARQGFREAQRIREEIRTAISDGAPIDPDWEGLPLDGKSKLVRDLAAGYYGWGNLDYAEDKLDEALDKFEKALTDARVVREAESDPEHERLLGNVLTKLGETNKRLKKFDEANKYFDEAETVLSALGQKEPDVDEYQRDLALLYAARARLRYAEGESLAESEPRQSVDHFLKAEEYRQKELAIFRLLTARRTVDPQFHHDRGFSHLGSLYARYRAGQNVDVAEFYQALQDAKDYFESIEGRFDKSLVRELQYSLCLFFADMASLPRSQEVEGRVRRLEQLQADYMKELAQRHRDDKFYQQILPNLPELKKPFTDAYTNACDRLEKELAEAKAADEAAPESNNELRVGNLLTKLGETKERLEMLDEADGLCQQAEGILLPLATENPDVDAYQRGLALLYGARAGLRYEQAGFLEAAECRQKQIELLEVLTARSSSDAQVHEDLGHAHIGLVRALYRATKAEQVESSKFSAAFGQAREYLQSIDNKLSEEPSMRLHFAFCRFFSEMAGLPDTDERAVKRLAQVQVEYMKDLVRRHPENRFYPLLPKLAGVSVNGS